MAYLTSFLLCLIVSMASSMPQWVTNANANDVVVGDTSNQGFQSNQNQFDQQQQQFDPQQQLNLNDIFNQPQQTPQQPQQTPSAPGAQPPRLTSDSLEVRTCVLACPSTNQYAPVCGSDSVLYTNEARLVCTNNCGRRLDRNWQDITILFRANCTPGSRVA